MKFVKLNDKAKLPTREPDSVGYDVYAFGDHLLSPGETKIIPLGFAAAIPDGHAAFIWDRSSFGAKGIHVFRQFVEMPPVDLAKMVSFGGCLDWSYRGQWGLILHSFHDQIYAIKHQQKLSQFVVQACVLEPIEEVTQEEFEALPATIRGKAGYGCSDGQNTPESAQAKIENGDSIVRK